MICNHHKDEGRACRCVETFGDIVAGENIPKLRGYCAIVRESAKHPELLKSFASDLLVWDRAVLTDYDGPFLWAIRESGTHLIRAFGDDAPIRAKGKVTRETSKLSSYIRTIESCGPMRWYFWDGHALRALRDAQEALTYITDVIEGAAEDMAS
jgi:hypothetical protein